MGRVALLAGSNVAKFKELFLYTFCLSDQRSSKGI